jgi:pseudouridine kinase
MKYLVFGATNIDILGRANSLILGDSNLGKIEISLGGVGKNIAMNLHNLGVEVEFLTQFGTDWLADYVKRDLIKSKLRFDRSFTRGKSNFYLGLFDGYGEYFTGINDILEFEKLVPKDFLDLDEYIRGFDALIIDANLSVEMFEWLCKKYQDKFLFVDGVSPSKVRKIYNGLRYIDVLKINLDELKALLQVEFCDIISNVKTLLDLGVKQVIVTNGKEDITYSIERDIFKTEVLRANVVKSVNGAGDSFFAGVIAKYFETDFHQAIEFGKKQAVKIMESFN